jgi:hypothetical protein
MKIELKKKTFMSETWYQVYRDGELYQTYLTLTDAEKLFTQLVDALKNPPVYELLKTTEIFNT